MQRTKQRQKEMRNRFLAARMPDSCDAGLYHLAVGAITQGKVTLKLSLGLPSS
jgi:hypothetical protein